MTMMMNASAVDPSGAANEDAGGLRVEDLAFAYARRQPVLARVAVRVDPGGVHCIAGPSGSGKSSLLRLIAGLEHPDAGRIMLDGELLAGPGRRVPPERRPVAMLFQESALFPHLDAVRNVIFGLRGVVPRGQRRAAAMDLLEQVGIADRATAMPHMLSGGQQRRVALARALARRPKIMLLDEPFASLDPALRRKVRGWTIDLLRSRGVGVVMVSHDPNEIRDVADVVTRLMPAGNAGGWTSAPECPACEAPLDF